jgi:4-carboxymuconolactone decarboxylase
VATPIALCRTNELPFHLERALDDGVTGDEIAEVITHLAFYSRMPDAASHNESPALVENGLRSPVR